MSRDTLKFVVTGVCKCQERANVAIYLASNDESSCVCIGKHNNLPYVHLNLPTPAVILDFGMWSLMVPESLVICLIVAVSPDCTLKLKYLHAS